MNHNIKKGTALKARIEELQKQVHDIELAIKEKKNLLSTLEGEKQQLQNSEPKAVDVIVLIEKKCRIYLFKKEVETLEASLKMAYTPADVSEHINSKKLFNRIYMPLKERLDKRKLIERTQQRINELQSQLSTMQQQVADFEQIEATILDFMKSKVALVDKRINSVFPMFNFGCSIRR